jgi:hypothetical protein
MSLLEVESIENDVNDGPALFLFKFMFISGYYSSVDALNMLYSIGAKL